jgi:acyl-CoA thioester hydrolase
MTASALLQLHRDVVRPEWIDYNGHMNLAYYVLVFDYATDELLNYIGLTEAFRSAHEASTFSAEIHVNYLMELKVGDEVYVTTQLLGFDEKRIHYFHRMHHRDGWPAATNELLSLYMDMKARKVAPMPEEIRQNLAALRERQSQLEKPEQAGRVISIGGRRPRNQGTG